MSEREASREAGVARSAVGMGAWAAASRGVGFGRVLVVAAVLGTTFLGNAFTGANSVSNVLFELVAAGALSAAIVPTFVKLLDDGRQAECERLAGSLLGLAMVALGAVTVVALALSPLIADLLTSGVSPDSTARSQRTLVAFLLPFFLPQVVLYGWGAVASAVLHARRRFAVTAAAPIGSSVLMVALLVIFHLQLDGAEPGLDLSLAQKLTLAGAGTLGVVGFVGVLIVGAELSGFRLRPRLPRGLRADGALRELVTHSTAGVFLHAATGVLLGAAIVIGGSVEGGFVAYQVAYVIFLAPYGIFGQPVHSAALPELTNAHQRSDREMFASTLRWSLDSIALLLVPVSVAFVVFAKPAMEVVAFGEATDGATLLAAAVASLGVGLVPYTYFHLLARAFYARGDSRTPVEASLLAMLVGVVAMAIGASFTEGAARVAAIGLGHSAAYTVGAFALWLMLARRTGRGVLPHTLVPAALLSLALGVLLWLGMRAVDPSARIDTTLSLAVAGAVGLGAYVVVARRVGLVRSERAGVSSAAG